MRSAVLPVLLCLVQSVYCQDTLSLKEAVKTGLENRFDIRIARNQLTVLDINNNYGNAGFYPSLFFSAGQNFTLNNTKQEFFSGDVREGNNVNSNALSAAVALDWTLFDGMNMFIQKNRLEKESSLGMEGFRNQVESTILDIRLAYLDIQEIEDRIKIIRQAIDISRERMEETENRYKIGTIAAQALLQARVDINRDSLALEQARLQLRNAKIRLNQTINRAPDLDFVILPETLEIGTYSREEMINFMLAGNSLLQMARINEELSKLNVKAVESQKLPSLNFASAYNFNRSEAEIGIFRFNRNSGLTYGLTTRWNIFDGFRVRNQSQVARIQVENSVLSREQLEFDLKTNIYQALEQMKMLQDIIGITADNIRLSEENVKISLDRFNIGSLTPLEVRTAQLDLINTSFQQLLQKYQLKRLEWNLLFAVGKISG